MRCKPLWLFRRGAHSNAIGVLFESFILFGLMQSVSAAFIDQRTNVGVIRKAPINGCLNRFGLPIRGGRKHKDRLEGSAVVMIDCLLARSVITMNGGRA